MSWSDKRSSEGLKHKRMIGGKWWRRESAAYLDANPICAIPGCYELAEHVDHVIAPKGDTRLFKDKRNRQGLCHSCHSRKTLAEQSGKPMTVKGCGADGQPLDPSHPWNKKG